MKALHRRVHALEQRTPEKGITCIVECIGCDRPAEYLMKNGRSIPRDSPERYIPRDPVKYIPKPYPFKTLS